MIDFSEEKPLWLDKWLSTKDLVEMFPNGAKISFFRNKNHIKYGFFCIKDNSFEALVDRFRPEWRLNKDNIWQPTCSCGVPDGKCPHTYAIALKVNEAIENVKSSLPKSENTPRKNDFSSIKMPEPIILAEKRNIENNIINPLNSDEKSKLIIEVDFKTLEDSALLRFYRQNNNEKKLLKLSQVWNLVPFNSFSRNSTQFNDDDAAFFVWIKPQLKKFATVSELEKWTALKISRNDFDKIWIGHWKNVQPQRFIDEETKQILQSSSSHVSISFSLNSIEDNKRIKIECIGTFEDGEKLFFYELIKQIKNNNFLGENLLNGKLSKIDYPFDSQHLLDLFGQKNPSIATEHLVANLPLLLNHRLDLVSGKIVKTKIVEVKIELSVTLQKNFLNLAFSYNGKSIYQSAKIIKKGSFFEIILHKFTNIAEISEFLKNFDFDGKNARIEITSKNLQNFCNLYDKIANEIKLDCDLESEKIIKGQDLQAKISATQYGGFLDLTTSWDLNGDYRFFGETIRNAIENKQEFLCSREGKWIRLDLSKVISNYAELKEAGISHGVMRQNVVSGIKLLRRSEFAKMLSEKTKFELQNIEEKLLSDFHYGEKFLAKLRPYQEDGFLFLKEMTRYGIGCVLADDMGLGKTVQILSLISGLSTVKKVICLVCAPASVVNVWKNEVQKFSPHLRIGISHGAVAKREAIIKDSANLEIIITSYGAARNDVSILEKEEFDLVVLDEAQHIRNAETLTHEAMLRLKSRMKIAVTGTPLENKATDLWSIVNFINPGFLGSYTQFKKNFVYNDSFEMKEQLAKTISPLLLRRRKELVEKDLPSKTIEVLSIEMSEGQRMAYIQQLSKFYDFYNDDQPNSLILLTHLMRLRQICCSPELLGIKEKSGKLELLVEMVKELYDEGHSVLIFSSFTSMLEIIAQKFDEEEIEHFTITGKTPIHERANLVDKFNESETPKAFLLSLKAAGTGLTLTKADYVFIYDPWWNPAAEMQAIDRTHRIGQTKPVIAYKLVAEDSLEEQIIQMQEGKQELFSQLVSETDKVTKIITKDFIDKLLQFR